MPVSYFFVSLVTDQQNKNHYGNNKSNKTKSRNNQFAPLRENNKSLQMENRSRRGRVQMVDQKNEGKVLLSIINKTKIIMETEKKDYTILKDRVEGYLKAYTNLLPEFEADLKRYQENENFHFLVEQQQNQVNSLKAKIELLTILNND